MIPLQGLPLENEHDDDRKDGQGNHFLDDFELHQVEGTAVPLEADPVGRHRETVLKKGNAPGKENDKDERPACRDFHLLQFEMAVPGERHEDIRENEHKDGPKTLHFICNWGANLVNLYDLKKLIPH